MRFYKIEAAVKTEAIPERTRGRQRENCFNFEQKCGLCTVKEDDGKIILFGIVTGCCTIEALLQSYYEKAKIELTDIAAEEITADDVTALMEMSPGNRFASRLRTIFKEFGIEKFFCQYSGHKEALIAANSSKEELLKTAEKLFSVQSLLPELERIYMGRAQDNALGHPVHYIIQSDTEKSRDSFCKTLLEALYNMKRIKNRRYAYIDVNREDETDSDIYEVIYKSCEDGAVVIRCLYDNQNDYRRVYMRNTGDFQKLCDLALKYRKKTLTVFLFSSDAAESRKYFVNALKDMAFIELKEDAFNSETARAYLISLAEQANTAADAKLLAAAGAGELSAGKLKSAFEIWYSDKLRTSVYPQYANVSTVGAETSGGESEPHNTMAQLESMIGLHEAKALIASALDYYKAQKLYREKGAAAERPAMHMVFTGNPGTAKTTVARLFAGIMKENGLLTKGELFEVGRADLVGKYVGSTAIIVQKKFKQAKGSVLFIDEAYSLVDDRNGLYGDEAINTIVQEMENNRDNMIVIFAGYPDKMEAFLSRNPGLRSRIAFHVPFSDYSVGELCSIADFIAESKGRRFSCGAKEKLERIFEAAVNAPDFGNGRYVRNLIEAAIMKQATRLASSDFDAVTADDIRCLVAEDIAAPQLKQNPQQRRIGFR